MAYGVLFGSRLLPQAAQRFSRTSAPAVSALVQRATAASFPIAPRAFASGTPAMRPAASLLVGASNEGLLRIHPQHSLGLAARGYGTRSLWNVKKGKFWFFVWVAPATVAAFVMQEVAGPYIFFHE
mmetsp:Transcript_132209/g.410903  ORF Transcript_132209/g.410903 Transcript_132209/m.410903 type:complete len:126 (-) Transcript_132209:130-507(-)